MRQAFKPRPHQDRRDTGIRTHEIISPVEMSHEFWLITYWTDEPSYRTWHRGLHDKAAHSGMPKGLKLVRGDTPIRYFYHMTS